jgi:zinc D-Ala-D-Ala carboxypeptidase
LQRNSLNLSDRAVNAPILCACYKKAHKMALVKDFTTFDTADWRWQHFAPSELACKCQRYCKGEYYHDPAFLDALEALRAIVGPLKINSGRRCKGHNKAVGGSRASMHMRTLAADISLTGHDRKAIALAARKVGFRGIGYGRTFIHVDLGIRRAWTYPGAMPAWVRALGYNPVTGVG